MTTTAPYSLPPVAETNWQPVTVEDNIQKAKAQTAGMDLGHKIAWFFSK